MPAAAPPFCCPERPCGRVKLFLSGNATAGEAGVPLPASPADAFPAKKLNPKHGSGGQQNKGKTPVPKSRAEPGRPS